MIKTPNVRRGIMGWKLSKIETRDQRPVNAAKTRKNKHKKHNSAINNISSEMLQNALFDRNRGSNKKKLLSK